MTGRLALVATALAVLAACAPSRREEAPAAPKPNVDPARAPRAPVRVPPSAPTRPEPEPERLAPPEVAAANDWMPLASTGAARFRREHPDADGRGVLIAILDTGVDPAVPGLGTTTTGEPKLADLRDFSGEGAVALQRLEPVGDTVEIGGRRLAGFGRVRAIAAAGPWYGGVVLELPLGQAPAADLDGNGVVGDTLPLVVARSTDGWVVIPDRDGDGSLAAERPVGDYLRAREWFGWSRPGRTPPTGVAVNLHEQGGEPRLSLVHDLDSHGTHVAGIAAGYRLYGAPGLDGAAPGAQLLGFKIANVGQGSVSTSGAILRALDHAIGFAAARRQPLVVNLSFGVGNELEGAATIDRLVDSVLRRHPDVILAVSAGNDGPGLSTLGFPGSARRAITVGATIPRGFLPPPASGGEASEPIAFFSGRGGEMAKPDLVAPGVAYSSVPRWNAGSEVKQGTSMAAPQVAGVAALVLSALNGQRSVDGGSMRRALMVTAVPVDESPLVEGGRGVPDAEAAYQWLRRGTAAVDVAVEAAGGGTAALLLLEPGQRPPPAEFTLSGDADSARRYRLRSDVAWLRAPARVEVGRATSITIAIEDPVSGGSGVASGTVSGWGRDTLAGPMFRLPVTVVRPALLQAGRTPLHSGARVAAGENLRAPFQADTALPFMVRVAVAGAAQAFAFLHEPHGRPYRGGGVLPLAGAQPAVFEVSAEDVIDGVWEAVVSASPAAGATATVEVHRSPAELRLSRAGEGVASARVVNRSDAVLNGEIGVALRGVELVREVTGGGAGITHLPVTVPAWAQRLVVEVRMDRGQWGRFTDFGVTLFDETGRRLEAEPMQYAVGRLTFVPAAGGADQRLRLDLLAGLADPADTAPWRAEVVVRAYAAQEVTLAPVAAAGAPLAIGPGARYELEFELPLSPWPVPEGAHPLAAVTLTAGGRRWSRESGLPLHPGSTVR